VSGSHGVRDGFSADHVSPWSLEIAIMFAAMLGPLAPSHSEGTSLPFPAATAIRGKRSWLADGQDLLRDVFPPSVDRATQMPPTAAEPALATRHQRVLRSVPCRPARDENLVWRAAKTHGLQEPEARRPARRSTFFPCRARRNGCAAGQRSARYTPLASRLPLAIAAPTSPVIERRGGSPAASAAPKLEKVHHRLG